MIWLLVWCVRSSSSAQEKVQRTAPPRALPQATEIDGTGELEKILLRRRGALEATPLSGEWLKGLNCVTEMGRGVCHSNLLDSDSAYRIGNL